MADLTNREMLAVMRGQGGQMTYVIANRLRADHRHHNGTLGTDKVLRRLKALEQSGIVERVPSVYARQIRWQVVEATCAVGGMVRPGAMCGSVLVGGRLCGHDGSCQHRRPVQPNTEGKRPAQGTDAGPV